MATTDIAGDAPRASSLDRGSRKLPARRAALAGARVTLADWARVDAGRLALWTPVAIGAGAAFYFTLKMEPPTWIAPALIIFTALATAKSERWRPQIIAVLMIALGFTSADWRAARVAAPMLTRDLSPREVIGRLVSIEESAKTRRLVIEILSIRGVDAEALPARARLTWRGAEFGVMPGDVIRLRAGLAPPPPPLAPGAFDFARQLFFQRIGAVGFAVTAPEIVNAAEKSPAQIVVTQIERARLALARRILRAAPGEGGAIVAAVVTGKREAVSERSEAALRDSGLAHLLAISGLHMGLATGLIFFAMRFALAAIEPIARRYPIKKWAAAAALLAGFGYLLLSGGGWSARRAFIMSSIFFIAILVDRRALSLRNVAVAATIILLMTPEAVLHPGFQMSFAAVTALIAAYEWASTRADPERSFSIFARARRYLVGIAVTDTIAATATAPYSLYHFNRAALYGLPANVISVPIMGLWVMPAAILALALMPFGLDAWAWQASAKGVELILHVGGSVADQPGSVSNVAQWPPLALVVLTLGGLWLCLQSAPWRLAGLAAIPVSSILIAAHPAPQIYVPDTGDNAAIVADGKLALFNTRKDRFAASVWKEHAGLDKERAETSPLADIGRCDKSGCVADVRGAVVAVSNDPLGLLDDCTRADLVIALYPAARRVDENCAATLIDRRAVWNGGAHAIWINKMGKIRIETINAARGERPWTRG